MKAVLIYSGGMDSTCLLYRYQKEIALAVTFTYGAKQDEAQTACAQYNCNKLGIKHLIIPIDFIGKYFQSSILKGGADVPHADYDADNMKSTVVPFRNGIMLAIAAGLAESHDLDTVLIANHAGDHAIYPDCRPGFISAMDSAIYEGTYKNIRLLSPYCNMTNEIALEGKKTAFPSGIHIPATKAAKNTAETAPHAAKERKHWKASTQRNMKCK